MGPGRRQDGVESVACFLLQVAKRSAEIDQSVDG
jgi:hypothetical protein